jgi:hypothetical protein
MRGWVRMSDDTMLGPGVHETEALAALENGDVETAKVRAQLAEAAAMNRLAEAIGSNRIASAIQQAAAPKYDL